MIRITGTSSQICTATKALAESYKGLTVAQFIEEAKQIALQSQK